MPITPKHAFKEKSTKLLILLPLRTIYNRTFQCETPCIYLRNRYFGNKIRMCETENKIAKVGQLMEPVDFGR